MEKGIKKSHKKLLLFIILAILLCAAAATTFVICLTKHRSDQSASTTSKIYTDPIKIAPYLYEISYTDYREDTDELTHNAMEAFGCSSVRNGNFYGRNFDYIFNDTPEFVIKVAAKEGRHASLGVATHYGLREASMENNEYDKQLEIIPNLTLDGINDAGVIASINVVPGAEDVEPLTGTNPDGEDLNAAFSVRYILDNASSADEAVELLKARNISGSAVDGLYLHIMIADAKKTYVVEFIDNKLVAEEKTGDDQIMTNFYVNLPELTEHADGTERYAILKENYTEGSTLTGMRDLMARVRFSNAYRYTTYPTWDSETMPQSVVKNPGSEEYETYAAAVDAVRKDYWIRILTDDRNPADKKFWHTTHNSVYDIEKKMIRLTVQEDYSHYYDFYL